jgi:ATP-dependent Lon protease
MILDRDHDGMEEVKTRILEFLAVKNMVGSNKNQIICLHGAPGVGKTSVVSSIAEALGRKYVRVALGGVRDEADIRGHRKTYIGAMPGRIIDAVTKAKVSNPLILLDEIDKITKDAHGDPASALLEVLDPDQNKNFRDHFIEVPFDLSECLFIATANTLDTIPRPLLDRMEVIEMKTYSRDEKFSIAKNHLIPKQFKRHGLKKSRVRMDDSAVYEMIDRYTAEAGVRNLERSIATVCRKIVRQMVEDPDKKIYRVSVKNLASYLGAPKVIPEKIAEADEIGVVNGLAYTSIGGDMLKVEAVTMQGSGKVEVTGSLGDVMKESAKIAVSIVRSNATKYGIDPDFHKNLDIHIHFPEGAVPKDGPSAGVTLVTVLTSILGKYPVRRDVAMTGEVTLTGRVIPIGGLREKSTAAYAMGIRTILIPADNMRDIRELDSVVAEEVKFIPCSNLEDVLRVALVREKEMEYDLSDTATDEKKEESKIVLPTSKGKRIYGTI